MSKSACAIEAVIVQDEDKVTAFKKLLKKSGNTPIVALFKASWCGHCQAVQPKFENVCQRKGNKIILVIADVDSSNELFQAYGVDGFPTVVLFKNGNEVQRIVGADESKITQMFSSLGVPY